MAIEPIYRLVLRLCRLSIRFLLFRIRAHAEPMSDPEIRLDLAHTLVRIDDALDLGDLGGLQGMVKLAQRKARGDLDLFNVDGQLQHAGMAREPSVDQWLAVDFGSVSEIEGVFSAPAKSGCTDWDVGGFVLAQGSEERLHDEP